MNLHHSSSWRKLWHGDDINSTRPLPVNMDASPEQAPTRSATTDSMPDQLWSRRHSTYDASAATDARKDSLLDPQGKRSKPSINIASTQIAPDPMRPKTPKLRSRNDARHIYLCAYHDDRLTPRDKEQRRRRGHMAFKWDILVKREAAEASGTRFHLTTRHVRPRGQASAGAEPPWRPRSQVPFTEQDTAQSADGAYAELEWALEVSRFAQSDSSMVMCVRVGTARYRHAGALGEDDDGEDDEDEIEELCRRTEVDADMTTWEWAAAVVERLWQNGIIWRHAVYAEDHDLFWPLWLELEDAYGSWRASAAQVGRRRPVHVVYPGLDKLSCDEEALQDAACGVCRRPRYGFSNEADVRWLFSDR